MAEKEKKWMHLYPQFSVKNNKNPNKLFAFPFVGIFIKIILLIPVFIELAFLGFVASVLLVINWFVVLFTGEYWNTAYTYFVEIIQFATKVSLYIYGLTDKYPGFYLDTDGLFELDIDKPKHPNRWLAIPVLGILVRFILLIPYNIFYSVMDRGSSAAMAGSWFVVTLKGFYPESLYEFERDTIRVGNASLVYILGLQDSYPSFEISINHQRTKIVLLIVGVILVLLSWRNGSQNRRYNNSYRYQYNNSRNQINNNNNYYYHNGNYRGQ